MQSFFNKLPQKLMVIWFHLLFSCSLIANFRIYHFCVSLNQFRKIHKLHFHINQKSNSWLDLWHPIKSVNEFSRTRHQKRPNEGSATTILFPHVGFSTPYPYKIHTYRLEQTPHPQKLKTKLFTPRHFQFARDCIRYRKITQKFCIIAHLLVH